MTQQQLPGVDWRECEEHTRWTTFANIWDFNLKCFVDYNDQGELVDRRLLLKSNDTAENKVQSVYTEAAWATGLGGSDLRSSARNGCETATV